MITEDVVVFLDPDHRSYLGNFTEQGWLRWPAEHDGWQRRERCSAHAADEAQELSPRLGWLALRLSGCRPQDDICAPLRAEL